MKHSVKFWVLGIIVFVPFVGEAVTLAHTLNVVSGIVNALIPIVLALAVLFFFWGLATYMLKAGEEKKEGISIMIMGTMAIFVMVSVWGIVRVLQQTFQVDNAKPIVPDMIERGNNVSF
jgi:uncharacterized membrane protein